MADIVKELGILSKQSNPVGKVLPAAGEVIHSGAADVGVDLSVYHTEIITGGTDGAENVTLGDGTGAVVGQRKLVTLKTRTSGSDVVNLDHANIANASGVQATNCDLDAAGEFFLFEWNGSKWQIVYGSGTIAP